MLQAEIQVWLLCPVHASYLGMEIRRETREVKLESQAIMLNLTLTPHSCRLPFNTGRARDETHNDIDGVDESLLH